MDRWRVTVEEQGDIVRVIVDVHTRTRGVLSFFAHVEPDYVPDAIIEGTQKLHAIVADQ